MRYLLGFMLGLFLLSLTDQAEANTYCKRGRFFYNASASVCNNRATNYCFSQRLGYRRCPQPRNQTTTPERQPGQAGFCRRGRVFHQADSPACRQRPSQYCFSRVRGYHRCTPQAEAPAEDKDADVPLPPPNPNRDPVSKVAEEKETTQASLTSEREKAEAPSLDRLAQSETTTQAPAEKTPKKEEKASSQEAQGDYCKVGRFWHDADSPVCRGRPIDQCRINGLFGDCDRSESTSTDEEVKTEGYRRMSCGSPQNTFQCMMCNCYHESRGESPEGRLAVGKVVMTRARMSAYPNTICRVIYQRSQFSWTHQGNRHNTMGRRGYNRCEPQVRQALKFDGHYASHFHRHDVYPRWRRNCRGAKRIGAHIFYESCGRKSRAQPGRDVGVDANF